MLDGDASASTWTSPTTSSSGLERTLEQDVAYGLRMLVDIAEQSSPIAFLDPTTAVQAIDRLHDCLRQLARGRSRTASIGREGVVRVTFR